MECWIVKHDESLRTVLAALITQTTGLTSIGVCEVRQLKDNDPSQCAGVIIDCHKGDRYIAEHILATLQSYLKTRYATIPIVLMSGGDIYEYIDATLAHEKAKGTQIFFVKIPEDLLTIKDRFATIARI